MNSIKFKRVCCLATCFIACGFKGALAQQSTQTDTNIVETAAKLPTFNWRTKEVPGLGSVEFWIMGVSPQSEPQPALRYRLIDDDYDLKDWNASVFYLRAIGYLDQSASRAKIVEIWKNAGKKATDEGEGINDIAPAVWQYQRPEDLPSKEVNEFLSLLEFQVPDLRDAQRCKSLSFDRHINELESPASLSVPELLSLRELGRTQRLRCRIAIKENRMEDAMQILRQQFAMARHLSDDALVVSNYVAASVAHVALDDALFFIEHPESPNLYWAFASLPNPLVSYSRAIGFERRFLLEEIKQFKEVDLTPKPAAFWDTIIERIAASLNGSDIQGWPRDNVQAVKSHLVKVIADSRPQASKYLHDVEGIPNEQLEKLDDNHLGMLALVRFYKHRADQFAKWTFIPHWQRAKNPDYVDFLNTEDAKTIGELTNVTIQFIAGLEPIYNAEVRIVQKIALLQAVEALRMYAAQHAGEFPESLNDTPVPVPVDPATGQAFRYVKQGDRAELTGAPFGKRVALQIELHLREAGPSAN